MLQAIKRIFYVSLFFGVIVSFVVRCTSKPTQTTHVETEEVEVKHNTASQPKERFKIPNFKEDPAKGLRQELSVEEFRANNTKLLTELPTSALIRKNPNRDDRHETPREIVAAGKSLGLVMDQMKSGSKYVEAGLDFYKECAMNSEIAVQIKALCLRNFKDWNQKLGKVGTTKFSPAVEKLASQIPKTLF